jgi:hypothetical protein
MSDRKRWRALAITCSVAWMIVVLSCATPAQTIDVRFENRRWVSPLSSIRSTSAVRSTRAAESALENQVWAHEKERALVDRVLVVRDPKVLEGAVANQHWSLGTLLRKQAGVSDPQFSAWMEWLAGTKSGFDGHVTHGSGSTGLYQRWKARVQGGAGPLDAAPFRLLAIVFRPDLSRPGEAGAQCGLAGNGMPPI